MVTRCRPLKGKNWYTFAAIAATAPLAGTEFPLATAVIAGSATVVPKGFFKEWEYLHLENLGIQFDA